MAMGQLVCIAGQAILPLQNQHQSPKSALSCEFVKIDSLWNILIKKTSGTWRLHHRLLQVQSWRLKRLGWHLIEHPTADAAKYENSQISSNISHILSHPFVIFHRASTTNLYLENAFQDIFLGYLPLNLPTAQAGILRMISERHLSTTLTYPDFTCSHFYMFSLPPWVRAVVGFKPLWLCGVE